MKKRKIPIYPVLESEIARQGIKKKEIAQKIGVSARTLSFKLSGTSRFNEAEKQVISHLLDCDVETLFQEKTHPDADKASECISIPVRIGEELIDTITVSKR